MDSLIRFIQGESAEKIAKDEGISTKGLYWRFSKFPFWEATKELMAQMRNLEKREKDLDKKVRNYESKRFSIARAKEETYEKVREMYKSGATYSEMAEEFNLSSGGIQKIVVRAFGKDWESVKRRPTKNTQ